MNNILFACDLDNTLLYSWKHRRAGDICVEMIHEREQGFMTPRTVSLLASVKKLVNFVPVTTRSLEQYRRIVWPAGCDPEYAVVANGAILLKNGEIEESWHKTSETLISPYRDELLALIPEFEDQRNFLRCRMVDNTYLFAYCGPNVRPEDCVCAYGAGSCLNVVSSGQKVYFFPPEIHKGSALKRLKKQFQPIVTIAAGDSAIDAPMLNEANLAIIPAGFPESAVQAPYCKARENETSFSEFVLEAVQKKYQDCSR